MRKDRFFRRFVRGSLSLAVLFAMGLGAVGCNTAEGAGEDIEDAGDAIKDTARDVKD